MLVLQTLYIACLENPTPTNPLTVSAGSIFNQTQIQPPALSSPAPASSGLHGTDLGLAIALPLVFVLILVAIGCTGCFFYSRQRQRKDALAAEEALRYSQTWADSPETPYTGKFQFEQPIGMEQMTPNTPSQRFGYSQPHSHNENVGPGAGQTQDPNLHDHYFPPASQDKVTALPSDVKPPEIAMTR